MKPKIHLSLNRSDGRGSDIEIEGMPVTQPMLDAAEDALGKKLDAAMLDPSRLLAAPAPEPKSARKKTRKRA